MTTPTTRLSRTGHAASARRRGGRSSPPSAPRRCTCVALFLLGRGRNSLVSPAAGPLAFLGAVGITLFGVYGWLYHGFVAYFWTRETDRRSA
jgi:hypothetical protein